jgi:hypothetical protein
MAEKQVANTKYKYENNAGLVISGSRKGQGDKATGED